MTIFITSALTLLQDPELYLVAFLSHQFASLIYISSLIVYIWSWGRPINSIPKIYIYSLPISVLFHWFYSVPGYHCLFLRLFQELLNCSSALKPLCTTGRITFFQSYLNHFPSPKQNSGGQGKDIYFYFLFF